MTIFRVKSRLTLLCLVLMFSFGAVFAQNGNVRISINKNKMTIKEALREVERQSKMSVAYNQSKLNDTELVDLNVSDKPLSDVLDQILSKTGFSYQIADDQIMIVTPKKAQTPDTKTIKGTVVDDQGEPIIGATVMVKGTKTGTITDIDGNYTIAASENDVLQFSYLGFQPKEVKVGNNTTIDVTMSVDTKQLDAVVVTALGITRAEKALSYNVQEITNDDLTTVKDVNFMNSLAGKVAGVNINSSAGAGGATRVVMRGVKSITKDNNALYVIDGVPIYNTSGGAIDKNYTYADQPRGEGISDLNPDDIESLSVLTGPAAAALYGSSAANGAIIITTKKGEAGKPKITVSNQLTFSDPITYYDFQNRYGAAENQFRSWGNRADGLTDNRLDFFKTGLINQTSVSLSVGSEKNQTYASFSHSFSEGVIPENKYNKSNLTVRNTTNFLDDKLTLDYGFSYIKQSDENIVGQGLYYNPIPIVYAFPVGGDLLSYKNFETYDSGKGYNVQNWPQEYAGILDSQNPYWLLNRMPRTNDRDRYMVNVNLKYKITDWLNVAGRVRMDNSRNEQESRLYASTDSKFSDNPKTGKLKTITDDDKQTYADVIMSINKSFDKFSINAIVGGSYSDMKSISKGLKGPLMVPNYFAMTNIDMKASKTVPVYTGWHQQDQSVFASFEAGYKNMLYLTLTGRNDWSSPLARTKNLSFFYPSVGLSFLMSEAVKLPEQISYLQLKASYSSVGSPIPRNLSIVTYPYNESNRHFESSSFLPLSDMKPERTNSWELGVSSKLFGNKLNFDFTYYHSNTINQTLALNISAMSLYNKMYVQAGDVRNDGIELAIGTDLKLGNVNWNSSFTAGYNNNKILKLIDENATVDVDGEKIAVGNMFNGEREAIGTSIYRLNVGGTMGDLYAQKRMKLDENGNPVLDATEKYPILEDTEEYLGTVLPKWNLGFRNSFTWKDFNFGFMISGRFGGIVMSPTEATLDGYGVTEKTAIARDRGYVKVGNVVFDPKDYYETVGSKDGLLSDYVYKADNIRLQEISLGYTIPKKVFNDKLKLNLSLVASNLFILYKDAPFDPEVTGSTGTFYQGVDFFMQPTTRNIGFSVKAEF
ncbi:SusC/RagA family TonB-linked outer membrane protein [Dysgonomonas sp. Marseille-P4361]|uniref:SusC/RagA family TonB-linked outer membrane protein n=1 Tax=Dysgonomonas sp. Marseille-P4361 TaxID=2161820 RepID=UPI000D554A5E|nr:SusC/RagA family TonB-linked outer membrane protein [Dysgonomonas sp. Marseille-P4361]